MTVTPIPKTAAPETCPFCDGIEIQRNSDRWGHYFMCECGARGPYGDVPSHALKTWNTRTASPRDDAGVREALDPKAVHDAFNDWAWNKKDGIPVGLMQTGAAARAGFIAGAVWATALRAPPVDAMTSREALEFYANNWRMNGDGDTETPGLSRSWMEPTDELFDDGGRKAREALASRRAQCDVQSRDAIAAICARLRAMPSSLNDACRTMDEAAATIEAMASTHSSTNGK